MAARETFTDLYGPVDYRSPASLQQRFDALLPGPFQLLVGNATRALYQDSTSGNQLEFLGTLSYFGPNLVGTSPVTAVRVLDPFGQVIAEAVDFPGLTAGDIARADAVLPLSLIVAGITPAVESNGSSANDLIDGGIGDDTLNGNGGNDILFGGAGQDQIAGGTGDDLIVGEDGDDFITGGSGNDLIDGGAGIDLVSGQEGNEVIFGDAGSDLLMGNAGDDIIMGERGGVSAAGGNDTIYGDDDASALVGGNDLLDGDGGDDLIDGGGGDDVIDGDSGNDTIVGGAGRDIMRGSDAGLAGPVTVGSDTFVYNAMTDAGDSIYGFDVRTGDEDTIDLRPLFESLGYFRETPRADGVLRVLQSGADAVVQVDVDGVAGGEAFISLLTLVDRTATDITDTVFRFIEPVTGVADAGPNLIVGNAGANVLQGLAGNDTLEGRGGDDTLYGDEGVDVLLGGDGNDVILGGADGDQIDGGAGNDLIVGEGGDDIVYGRAGDDLIDGRDGDDTLEGQDGTDVIFGDAGADLVRGGNGNDMLMGERGGVSVAGGNDTIHGDDDPFALTGGDDLIDGDAGDDVIYGGGGNDVILGDNGNDIIEGGAGADLMGGSAASIAGPETIGSDLFVYRAMTDAGDTIHGFDIRPGDNDGIDLRPLFDALGYAGGTPRADGFLRVQQSGADAVVEVDADGAAAGVGFVTMVTLIDRSAGDITDSFFLVQ